MTNEQIFQILDDSRIEFDLTERSIISMAAVYILKCHMTDDEWEAKQYEVDEVANIWLGMNFTEDDC